MTYLAYELLARLNLLSLCGQNEDGELEFVGTRDAWQKIESEEKRILLEAELKKF